MSVRENQIVRGRMDPAGADDGPFPVDVTTPDRHRYGPRLRVGIRYLFRAPSGALFPSMVETGAAAWVPLGEIDIPRVRSRVEHHLIGTR
ncbi:hypothetical protein ACIQNU_20735 [Streptomyces sp. NPDC091292]|uniref:hypothetical protein n=1 Tax=Streptomyces sp. NPDC091292 TaxID=3365991 RepID=UPI00382C22E9